MKAFQSGVRVRFLNDVGEAVVVSQEGSAVTVTDQDGFDRTVEASELMLAPDAKAVEADEARGMDMAQLLRQDVGEKRMRALRREFEVKYRHAQATSMHRKDAHMEVDPHP